MLFLFGAAITIFKHSIQKFEYHLIGHFIAYASGHFSDTQIHYHSVFKEILAVKHGI